MNVIVRFYWQHDLDLVALVKHPDFEMDVMMKEALSAYVRGNKDFSIPLPAPKPYRVELDSCYIHFTLNHQKDKDLIDFIKTIRYGFRNSALKMIFRNYMESYNMNVFFDDQNYLAKSRGAKRGEKLPGTAPASETVSSRKKFLNQGSDLEVQAERQELTRIQETPAQEPQNEKIPVVAVENKRTEPPVPEMSDTVSVYNEPEEDFDLSQEEDEGMAGDGFDLFSALDKLM